MEATKTKASKHMHMSKSMKKMANNMNKSSDPNVVLSTGRIIITKDKDGLHGEAAYSKASPRYLKKFLESGKFDDDPSTSQGRESFDSSCSRSFDLMVGFKKRVQEEERLSRMYKLRHSFSLRFDNRCWLHPDGTTNFDYKGIPEEKKPKFERFKNRVRRDNYEYLGNHPEIQAIIAVALKKLLSVLPQDPVKYLTEFFTAKMSNQKGFESTVEAETDKISRYRVQKMQAAGKINIRPWTAVRSEISGETWRPEIDGNYFKKMNIGALAQDFAFDGNSVKQKHKTGKVDHLQLHKKKKNKAHQYCGCKDWKLKKNQSNIEESLESEDAQTTTFSTLGNIQDDLVTFAVGGEGDEEGDKTETAYGDGQFFGEMEEREGEDEDEDEEITQEKAERIASILLQEFLT